MALPRYLDHIGSLVDLFSEYALISGLALSAQKTVLVLVNNFDTLDLRGQIGVLAPAWGRLTIDSKAKYLGMIIGPGCGA